MLCRTASLSSNCEMRKNERSISSTGCQRRRLAEHVGPRFQHEGAALAAPFAAFVAEPALADAGRRGNADRTGGALLCRQQGVLQDTQLLDPVAQRPQVAAVELVAGNRRPQPDQPEHLDRVGEYPSAACRPSETVSQ